MTMQVYTPDQIAAERSSYKQLLFKRKLIRVLGPLVVILSSPIMMKLLTAVCGNQNLAAVLWFTFMYLIGGVGAVLVWAELVEAEANQHLSQAEEASLEDCAGLAKYQDHLEVKSAIEQALRFDRKLTKGEVSSLISSCSSKVRIANAESLYPSVVPPGTSSLGSFITPEQLNQLRAAQHRKLTRWTWVQRLGFTGFAVLLVCAYLQQTYFKHMKVAEMAFAIAVLLYAVPAFILMVAGICKEANATTELVELADATISTRAALAEYKEHPAVSTAIAEVMAMGRALTEREAAILLSTAYSEKQSDIARKQCQVLYGIGEEPGNEAIPA